MENISFDSLPQQVSQLSEKLERIERLLTEQAQQPTEQPDILLTVKQAAEFLNLSVPTMYTKCSRGELPFMKRSKRLYFSRVELMNYLKEGRNKTNAEIKEEASDYLTTKKGGRHE